MEKCAKCGMEINDDSKCKCDSKLCKHCCDCSEAQNSNCDCGDDCGCK